ncbi:MULTISPECIES: tetratricopeptide repeat-containing protein [unclassified Sphingomonas]|uniref:tetratricopeptide repeat-containing protein n=1 Tax=unclassified Sphingomonas TaxID=196159 RepID=UPI00215084AB|nr:MULTISPECIES: tetratricopeptide repeat-containing protein [unclassified Sphingomonas]MCR5869996.1 tetratricopeptide repeat-containing protein [Sphingomonas sp. J344]UUX98309.1 tetratricopeptide repeat-containing protein [Sphingomonas sp. J315]
MIAIPPISGTALAAPVQRWPLPENLEYAYGKSDLQGALAMAAAEIARCEATRPTDDRCFDLLRAGGKIANDIADFARGEAFSRRAVQIADRTPHLSAEERASAYRNLAAALDGLGRWDEAERLHARILPLYVQVYGAGSNEHLVATVRYANNLLFQDKAVAAQQVLIPMERFRASIARSNFFLVRRFDLLLGETLQATGDFERADAAFRRFLARLEHDREAPRTEFVIAYSRIAGAQFGMDEVNEAIRFLNAAIAAERDLHARDQIVLAEFPDITDSDIILARLATRIGDHARAERVLVQLAQRRSRRLGATHPRTLAVHGDLAAALLGAGRRADALREGQRCISGLESGGRIGIASARCRAIAAEAALVDGRAGQALELAMPMLKPLDLLEAADPARIDGHALMTRIVNAQRPPRLAQLRYHYRIAARGTVARMARYRDFSPLAQNELRRRRPVFTGQVGANWALGAGR